MAQAALLDFSDFAAHCAYSVVFHKVYLISRYLSLSVERFDKNKFNRIATASQIGGGTFLVKFFPQIS